MPQSTDIGEIHDVPKARGQPPWDWEILARITDVEPAIIHGFKPRVHG